MAEIQEPRSAAGRLEALHEFGARFAATPGDVTGRLDDLAAEVLDVFEQAGVEALLLKGRALAVLLYGGARRGYSDVDLLVAPHQRDAAEVTLRALGYENALTARGIDDVGGVVHAEPWVRATLRANEPETIDLHRWIAGARATPAAAWEALSARRMWIEVGSRQAAVLDRAGQAMHLALHASQHGPAYQKHVDELALGLERWPADVWESAALLAQEMDATDAFAAGLRLLPAGAAAAARLALQSNPEFDWTIRHGHERPRGTIHLQAFAEAAGTRERLGVLRRSLLPSRVWITNQHQWAQPGGLRVIAAYGAHLARAPGWAARAWLFRGRARRAGRVR
jgi:hypothetical protein